MGQAMDEQWIERVIGFWFEETRPESWFSRDSQLDAAVGEKFGQLIDPVSRLAIGELATPRACLAGVIVLDQFPRNLYRNSPRAFATDQTALAHSRYAIEQGLDVQLADLERMFLYMPWQHAEDPAAQAFSVQLFEQLGMEQSLEYAREHQRIVDLFGRFPHRNAALGRTSTAAEVEFMRGHPGF